MIDVDENTIFVFMGVGCIAASNVFAQNKILSTIAMLLGIILITFGLYKITKKDKEKREVKEK